MAEYINRDELKEALLRRGFYPVFVKTALESLPAIDIVRCKDCVHSYFVKSCSKYECRKGCGTLKYSNDFCSYGERRDSDEIH